MRPSSGVEQVESKMAMNMQADYEALVQVLAGHFGERLKMIVLFGSRSRGEAGPDSDHDIFAVIADLPRDPLARQRAVMQPLLPELLRLPERLAIIAKTPQELQETLTPLLVDVCIDGVCLYGLEYFQSLKGKVVHALESAGLRRQRLAGAWMWLFPSLPRTEWEVTWEGYRERV